MFQIECDSSRADAPEFIGLVEQIIRGVASVHRPAEAQIFRVDNWFGHKWLGFSGKVVGAVGSWRRELTPPPFVANRLVDETAYVRDEAGEYVESTPRHNIHAVGPSDANLHRRLSAIAPSSALFWFSSGSQHSERGSLMAYIPLRNDHWPWYLSFERREQWKVARRKDIQEYELRAFMDAGGLFEPAPNAATEHPHSP